MNTDIISQSPLIVLHSVQELADEEQTIQKTEETKQFFSSIKTPFGLIIDFSKSIQAPYNMRAHAIWAKEIKENPQILKHALKRSIVGKKSEHFDNEKALLESKDLRFFYSKDDALAWLLTELHKNEQY